MKKIAKKIVALLTIFTFTFITFIPYLAYAQTEPVKGDIGLKVESNGKTSYTISEDGSVTVSADNGKDSTEQGYVSVTKTVSTIDKETGKYHVKFVIKGNKYTTTTATTIPSYTVFVMDSSKSMDCTAPAGSRHPSCSSSVDPWVIAKNAAKSFSESFVENGDSNYLALVTFNSSASIKQQFQNGESAKFTDSEFGNTGQGTNYQAGLDQAFTLLSSDSIPENASKNIIFISDGAPNAGSCTSTTTCSTYLNGKNPNKEINIYTFAYGLTQTANADAYNILKGISTENKVNECDTDNIDSILAKLVSIVSSQTPAGNINHSTVESPSDNGFIDGIGSDFKIVDSDSYGGSYTYDAQTTITEAGLVLEFDIQIDQDTETGWHQTNNTFQLKYTDSKTNETITITCDDDPYVYWVQNTYDYEVRFYYEDDNGNYVEDISLTQKLQAAHGATVSELTSEILGSKHLKDGYRFIEVKNGTYELINELDNKYSIVVDKNSTTNIIRVYYQKVFTLSITKSVEDYDEKNPDMNRSFTFQIKLTDNTDNPITGTYLYKLNNETDKKEIVFNQLGTGTFNLKHNDIITFINLPRNIKYEVTELDSDGYVVEITYPDGSSDINTTTGILNLDSNQEIGFLNITGYILPETGTSGGLILSIMVVFLLGTPIVYLIYSFVKKRYVS